MINEKRRLWKLLLFTLPTLGIYNIYFWYRFTKDLNEMNREEKKIKNYFLVLFLTLITLGIYRWYWLFSIEDRLQVTGEQMGIKIHPGPGCVLFFRTFGTFVLFGPILADFFVIHNMNRLAREYNSTISKKTKVTNPNDELNLDAPATISMKKSDPAKKALPSTKAVDPNSKPVGNGQPKKPANPNGKPVGNGQPKKPANPNGKPVDNGQPKKPANPNSKPANPNGQPKKPANPNGKPVDSNGQPKKPANPNGKPVGPNGQPKKPANPNGKPVGPNGQPKKPTGSDDNNKSSLSLKK